MVIVYPLLFLYRFYIAFGDITIFYNHYANTSMQCTAIFHGCKNGNFQMKKCDIFHIFAQNIDRGYMLEQPQ